MRPGGARQRPIRAGDGSPGWSVERASGARGAWGWESRFRPSGAASRRASADRVVSRVPSSSPPAFVPARGGDRWLVAGVPDAERPAWRVAQAGRVSRSGTRIGAALYRASAPATGPAPGMCRDSTSRNCLPTCGVPRIVPCIRARVRRTSPRSLADGTARPAATRPAAFRCVQSSRVIIGDGFGERLTGAARARRYEDRTATAGNEEVASPMSAPTRIAAHRAPSSPPRERGRATGEHRDATPRAENATPRGIMCQAPIAMFARRPERA